MSGTNSDKEPARSRDGRYRTQCVTSHDLEGGHIRIPYISAAPTQELFPPEETSIAVKLKGRRFECSWNPVPDTDSEKSGILKIGAALSELVRMNEILYVFRCGKGPIVLK